MRFRRALALSLSTVTALSLAACSDDPSGPGVEREACADAGVSGAEWAGDARLDRGEALLLEPGASLCLVLPDHGTREYVLAYLDTRALEAARTARETALDTFSVTVRDLSGPAAARATRLRPPSAHAWAGLLEAPDFLPAADVSEAPTPNAPALRARPWTAGEDFVFYDRLQGAERPARVLRVYDGWLVLAAFDEAPADLQADFALRMDTAFAAFRQHFVNALPTTSAGSGQLLVLADPTLSGAAGIAAGETVGGEAYTWISLIGRHGWTGTGLASLLQHEVAHAFQRAYVHSTRDPASPVVPVAGASRWGIEGGATVMQFELLRRWAGVDPLSNFDWRAPPASQTLLYYRSFATAGGAPFTAGYGTSASLLLDLAARRVARGEAYDAALAAVLRGGIEGWYGHSWDSKVREGLVPRMRARLGSGWDPAEGLLTWILAQAVDDETENDVFQNPYYLSVSGAIPIAGGTGWPADAELVLGGGERLEVRRAYGSPGFFRIAGGGALHLSGGVPGVRWMLVRSN
ncbi:MAG TPA: hypothetical protein VHG91_09600 [Longimicrobium sp.]|nr:hypothetical protein [Longimicrobium sp.]